MFARLIVFLTSLLAVNAFLPTGKITHAGKSQLKMGFEKEVGAQAPLGFFDPLGLLKGADQDSFDYLRKAETKHGRIAMLAIVGHIVTTAGWRLSGDIAYGIPFSSVKNGLAAFNTIPAAGVAQILLFIGLLEIGYGFQEKNIVNECKFRMNAFGWNEATQRNKLAIELNNGRAAQMGILGLMVHEKLNNDPYVLNHLLGFPVSFNQ